MFITVLCKSGNMIQALYGLHSIKNSGLLYTILLLYPQGP